MFSGSCHLKSNLGTSLIAQLVKNLPAIWFDSWVRKIHWRRDRLPTPVLLGFPCGSAGKESAYNVGDLGSIHGLGRSPAEGKGYPLQYSGLENSMDSIVHSVTKSRTRLSNFHFHFLSQSTEERKNIFQCTHAMKNERQLQRTR